MWSPCRLLPEWTKWVYKKQDKFGFPMRKTSVPKGPMPYNWTLAKGQTHVIVKRGYVDFLLHDPRAGVFMEWLRDTNIPDEHVFSTLANNPQLNIPGTIKGRTSNGRLLQGFRLVLICEKSLRRCLINMCYFVHQSQLYGLVVTPKYRKKCKRRS